MDRSAQVSPGLCLCRATAMQHSILCDPPLLSPRTQKNHGILTWVQLKFQHRLKKRKTVNVKKKKKTLHSFIYSVLKPMMCQAQSLRTERTMAGNHNVAGWVRIMGLREVLQEITSKLKPGKLNEYELSRQKQKRRRKEECHRRALPK